MHCDLNQLLRLLRLLSDEELIRLGRRAELVGDSEVALICASEQKIETLKETENDHSYPIPTLNWPGFWRISGLADV
jgi:hypothetical protein